MVSFKQIQASNALINDATAPRVAVFVGGTSGIGQLTIRALVATGASTRLHIIGRKSSAKRTQRFIEEMKIVNPKADFVWTEGEVSLLADATRVCEIIKRKESSVDLLFMTTGYAPFGARQETSEGIEITQSLEYYTRIAFILHLLPLLNEAEAPRVVSVMAGGFEKATIDLDDLELRKPGSFNLYNARMLNTTITSTTMEKLSEENPNITFVHSSPGWVDTGNVKRGAGSTGIVFWLVWLFLEPLIRVFSQSDDYSGQVHLFKSTSAAFGGRGIRWDGKAGVNTLDEPANGLFLVGSSGDCTANAKVMASLRKVARGRIWDYMQAVLKPYI